MRNILVATLLSACVVAGNGQTYNSQYVNQLYAKYPTNRSNLCPACKVWVNPVFASIADTLNHYPVCEYYIYTKAHEQAQIAAKIPRTGIYAQWHSVQGQPDMQAIYAEANKQLKVEVAKGHVVAFVWADYSEDGAILSNTYDFNCGLEYQAQNIGTELQLERYIRAKALQYDTVLTWGGCYAGDKPQTIAVGSIAAVMTTHYWKIIKYNGVYECWLLPNLPTETADLLPKRTIALKDLILILGFDPEDVLK